MHDAHRRALREDGFAVIRGLLGADDVQRLRDGFERLVAIARALEGTADVGGARFVVDAAPFRLHRVVWCGGAAPALLPFGADPRFVDVAATALSSDRVDQLLQQAHFKLPGDGVSFGWHQDASNRRYGTDRWRDLDGRGSLVQVAVAVDPMSLDNGGLRFLAGSHREGFVADPSTGAVPDRVLEAYGAVDPVLEPGDAVVFGPFVVHGSGPNRGEVPRRLFLQGYALPGANGRVYPGSGLGVPRSR
jgi:ectoine hydroxylase-related dioxygenase (phytanoyl-CoA dioxygenase family)